MVGENKVTQYNRTRSFDICKEANRGIYRVEYKATDIQDQKIQRHALDSIW